MNAGGVMSRENWVFFFNDPLITGVLQDKPARQLIFCFCVFRTQGTRISKENYLNKHAIIEMKTERKEITTKQ